MAIAQERVQILETHSRALPLGSDVELQEIGAKSHGYSGADLAAVTREAALHAMHASVASASSLENPGMAPVMLQLLRTPVFSMSYGLSTAHRDLKVSQSKCRKHCKQPQDATEMCLVCRYSSAC